MGKFSNPLVMSFTGIEEDDSGMGAKASSAVLLQQIHREPTPIRKWNLRTLTVSRALSSSEQGPWIQITMANG